MKGSSFVISIAIVGRCGGGDDVPPVRQAIVPHTTVIVKEREKNLKKKTLRGEKEKGVGEGSNLPMCVCVCAVFVHLY